MRCPQCQIAYINGIRCHETGCPEAWKDYDRECDHCGCDFRPEERYQRFCSPCCACSAFGHECECEICAQFYRECQE